MRNGWQNFLNVDDAFKQELSAIASRVTLVAKRYEHSLSEIEEKEIYSDLMTKR